jgi:hypothetical protein
MSEPNSSEWDCWENDVAEALQAQQEHQARNPPPVRSPEESKALILEFLRSLPDDLGHVPPSPQTTNQSKKRRRPGRC